MNSLLMDKFGPRLREVANLLGKFQARKYYVYDSKDLVENFQDSTEHLLNILLGSPDDDEEEVFEKLENDIQALKRYLERWDELFDVEKYQELIFIARRLHEELESLLVAWNTQTDIEKREVLSSIRKQSSSKDWI